MNFQAVTTKQLTFEQLPEAVSQLFIKLDSIEQLLLRLTSTANTDSEDLVNIKQVAAFLSLSVATIYTLVSRKDIPCMKQGKRLYFSKKEINSWVKEGKKNTLKEVVIETDNYLSEFKRKEMGI